MIRLVRSPIWTLGVALLAIAARAEWTVQSENSEPGRGGIEHRHLVLENASAGDRAVVDLAVFSPKSCTLRVIDNQSGATLADAARRESIIAGVNGGYFDTEFAPMGLRIINRRTIAPLRRAKLLTGVLTASSRGVEVLRLRRFSPPQKVEAAIQCGPFLVDAGKAVSGLADSRLARRTFAAISPDHRAALGVCSDISLAQLAEILTAMSPRFRIDRALNLDGGSSSAFWLARENGSAFSISEQKPVRDFAVIVGK